MEFINVIFTIFVIFGLISTFRKGAAKRAEQAEALKSAIERAQAMPPRNDAAVASPLSQRAVPHPYEPYVSPYAAPSIVAPSEGVLSIPEPRADVVGVPIPTGGSILGATFEGIGTEGESEEAHAAHVPQATTVDLDAQGLLAQITLAELRRAVVLSELLGPPRAHRRAGRATH